MKKFYLFFIVTILSFILRFNNISTVPPSLNADEAAIGYNAYSILKTGRDEYGQEFPLAFRSFDDYKAPLYIYLTSLSIAIFGLNDFAVRFFSAFTGVLTVCLLFFLTENILSSSRGKYSSLKSNESEHITNFLPFVASLILALSPWHLHFSRSAYEGNLAVFFIVLGLTLFYMGLKNARFMPYAGVPFALSMWSYHAPRVFVPLLVFCLLILYWSELRKIRFQAILSFILASILIIPIVFFTLSPQGLVRARGISSLENPQILERSIKWISDDDNSLIAKIIHNRRIEYAREILKGYAEHYNPVFLFLDKAEAKYRAPGVGLMYLWELPFLISGFSVLLYSKEAWAKFILLWFFLAPIAAAPTLWLPSPIRTIVFLPVLQIITAFGLVNFFIYLKSIYHPKRLVIFIIVGISILVNVSYYFHQYYVHLPKDNASDWQYGRKEIVETVLSVQDRYDRIVVSPSLDQPQIFFLYFLAYDPHTYLREGGTLSGKFDAQDNHFSKYYFSPPSRYQDTSLEKILYITTPSEVMEPHTRIKDILYPNGETAFVLYEK